jgi:regulation of enolase protein 1 (concanavalin A-like superfamily)
VILQSDLSPVGQANGAVTWSGAEFSVRANPKTDAYTSPDGSPPVDRLPGLRFVVGAGPRRVSARVTPAFAATYDAGALVLRTSLGHWAKLAYERSPDGRAMAVSVVTTDFSDDSNGPVFDQPWLGLRIYRNGRLTAFHVSGDGRRWDLLRLFNLPGDDASIDFVAQSPMGQGVVASFAELECIEGEMTDFRDGA